jgi:two-component sensor histidine kinase
VKPVSPVEALHGELRDASPTLIGNADLLRSVLSGCGDCIKVLDLDGRLIFMSEGGKRVMEVEDFSALKGCPWPEFWAGEGNAHAMSAVDSAREGKTARFRGAANTAKGNPRYWDVQVSPIVGDDGKPSHLLSISRDITEEWNATELLKKNAERQHFLTAELQHRVKNMLATVMAIANRTFRGEAHEVPRTVFGARLMTLSQAHDALTESNWDRAAIVKIIKGALEFHQFDRDRVVVAGPDLDLDPKQALALALAINELATNASKYGALSNPSGIVRVSWSCKAAEPGPAFVFEWREIGGPAVVAPSREGFGTRVIKSSLADDFGGAVELTYEPAGFVCTLTAPLDNLPKAPSSLPTALPPS